MARSAYTEPCADRVLAFWAPDIQPIITRYLDQESFVNAIAPKDESTKLGRAKYGILFRVADTSGRGLVSWEDFVVFETVLKRPDADYWIAFQYFDKSVFFNGPTSAFLIGIHLQRPLGIHRLRGVPRCPGSQHRTRLYTL